MPKLTKRTIDSVVARDKPYLLFDDEVRGFAVRVLPSGEKTYLMRYRFGGADRKLRLGRGGDLTPDEAHSTDELTQGLPDLAAPSTATEQASLEGEPIAYEVLANLLGYLDPNCPRDEWIRVVAGIRAAPILDDPDDSKRRELAHRFSRGKLDRQHRYDFGLLNRYSGPDDVDQAFDTMSLKLGASVWARLLMPRGRQGGEGERTDDLRKRYLRNTCPTVAPSHFTTCWPAPCRRCKNFSPV